MIGIICGEKGSGKTKRLLNMANATAKEIKGSIVFIDDDNSYMFDLATSIRFINASEYEVNGADMLFGFISGIAAQDFDLECIYIDKFKKLAGGDLNVLGTFFDKIIAFSEKRSIRVVVSVSEAEDNLPGFMTRFLLPSGN